MEGYRRLPGVAPGDIQSAARETLDEAGAFLRRLIPFPGTESLSPLSLLSGAPQDGTAPSKALTAPADIVGNQAASIVSQAASILDEEMARGVLAARHSADTAPYGRSDGSNPVLRQVHELVDNIAALWPTQPHPLSERSASSPPGAYDASSLAELRPQATVRPGQRATISMTVCNSESRAVRLVPSATDLLGSRGGRIACSLFEFAPSELRLEPQEQRELSIATTVPVDAAPGCYSGLLVVKGVDYLRALITIEVE